MSEFQRSFTETFTGFLGTLVTWSAPPLPWKASNNENSVPMFLMLFEILLRQMAEMLTTTKTQEKN